MTEHLSPHVLIKHFRDTMTHGVTRGERSNWAPNPEGLEEYVPFIADRNNLPHGGDIVWENGAFRMALCRELLQLPYPKCMFVYEDVIVTAVARGKYALEIYGFIAVQPRVFTALIHVTIEAGDQAPNEVLCCHATAKVLKGREQLAYEALKWLFGTLEMLSQKDVQIEVQEYPAAVQNSRRKHRKAPIPAIRRIRPGSMHVNWGREGSHTPKSPHDRRGHWATLRDGRKIWKKSCKVKGGGQTPPAYAVETPTVTIWPKVEHMDVG